MSIDKFSPEFIAAFDKDTVQMVEGVEPLTDSAIANIQELFTKFQTAVATAQAHNVNQYIRDLELVEQAAQDLSDAMKEAGVEASLDYDGFGAADHARSFADNYNYRPGVIGAQLAGTWLPSSYGC